MAGLTPTACLAGDPLLSCHCPGIYDPFADFTWCMRSSDTLDVFVLQDGATTTGKIWRVNEISYPVEDARFEEPNMGGSRMLYDFVSFCRRNSSASRYIISFYDHGGAWYGACWDKISRYDNLTMDEWYEELTMSAIRTDKLFRLIHALDVLSLEYLSRLDSFRSQLDLVYEDMARLDNNNLVDIHDFIKKLLTVETDERIRAKLEMVQSAMEDVVIAECHGADMEGTYGLSIYFPNPCYNKYDPLYRDPGYGLGFTKHTHRDELLAAVAGPAAAHTKKSGSGYGREAKGMDLTGGRGYVSHRCE